MKYLIAFLLLIGSAFAQIGVCPKITNHAVINATSSGDNTLIAADASGRRIMVWKFFLVNSHATQDESLTWKEGSTAVSGVYLLKANGGAHVEKCDGTVYFSPPAGSAVVLNLSASGTITGEIWYSMEQP